MFFVYILKTAKQVNHKRLYIGFTNDLRSRLEKHNMGMVESTKPYAPYRLVYYEAYSTKKEALEREKNLKLRANAWNQLKQRIFRSINAD
jgi:putative endonuclease